MIPFPRLSLRDLPLILLLLTGGCAHTLTYCNGTRGWGNEPVYRHGSRCAVGDPEKAQPTEPTYFVRDCGGC